MEGGREGSTNGLWIIKKRWREESERVSAATKYVKKRVFKGYRVLQKMERREWKSKGCFKRCQEESKRISGATKDGEKIVKE